MSRWLRGWLLGITAILGASPCGAQVGAGSDNNTHGTAIWRVIGRVSTTRGIPLDDVIVQMEIGPNAEVRQSAKTNLRGEFQIEVKLDNARFPRLRGTLVASKTGYVEGREALDAGPGEKNGVVDIILREPKEDPDQLSMTKLVSTLGPHLRDDSATRFTGESVRKEFVRGCEELIDRGNAVAAIPLLNNSVERTPNCIECRMLLSLALLEAGSWSSAYRQLEQASKANDLNATKRPEPAVVMGVLKAWWGSINEAVGLYQRALEVDPQNMLALQELGRALVVQKNWEAADQYLEKALQASAGGGYPAPSRTRSPGARRCG